MTGVELTVIAIVVLVVLGVSGTVATWYLTRHSHSSAGDRARLAVLHTTRAFARTDVARLRAISRFAVHAPHLQRVRCRGALVDALGGLSAAGPELAAAAVALLHRPLPSEVPVATRNRILVEWTRHARVDGFDRTWETMATTFARGEDALVGTVLSAVGAEPVSPAFARGAVRRLDARLRRPGPPQAHGDALALLDRMGGGPVPHWHCVLGDTARARGADVAAANHYRRAVDGGFGPARARLADLLAGDADRLVRDGRAAAALPLLHTVGTLSPNPQRPDPEYRELTLTARLLAGEPVAALLPELTALHRDHGRAALVTAAAQLEAGRPGDAVDTLRSVPADPATTEPARETAAALLALAERAEGLVGLAAHLLARHGSRWAAHSQVPADDVVLDAAVRDSELLDPLLAGWPDDVALGPAARTAAARTLLGRAARAEHVGLAVEPLTRAELLLEGDD